VCASLVIFCCFLLLVELAAVITLYLCTLLELVVLIPSYANENC
jgi:hypothetical protein